MEIVRVVLARAVWLFDTQELNPRGVATYPDLYVAFGKRYQFTTLPKPEDIHAGGSVYFKQGKFPFEASSIAVEFELHNDGLVVNTRHSTEAADGFLQDALAWCAEQFSIKYPANLVKKRIYRSELIVSMSPQLDALATKIGQFAAAIATTIPTNAAGLTGLQFGSHEVPAAFYVERRAGNVPFDDNHYLANAWTTTSRHLALLESFEQIMSAEPQGS
jgi:hypothetical protein